MFKLKDILLLILIIILTIGLVLVSNWTNGIVIFDNLSNIINKQTAYQAITLLGTFIFLFILWWLKRSEFKEYFRKGNICADIIPEPIVGIKPNKTENWFHFGRNFAIIISAVTAIIIYFQIIRGNEISIRNILNVLPFSIAFAISNSFVEESITRLGLVVVLKNRLKDKTIPLVSALIFGIVHYWGNPGGFTGVLVAGFLGWFLAKSILETKGIYWAWLIHFVQDIIIFSALLTMHPLSISNDIQYQSSVPDYHIKWDDNSLVCIAEEGAYPRLTRLNGDSLLVVYENRKGDVVLKKSGDSGKTWGDETIAFKGFEFIDSLTQKTTKVNIANPEIIQLLNGDILLATNLRPRNEGVYPFSIALKRSRDGGNTWSDADILFRAGKLFRDGCWEPSFLLLPDGIIHIYFANEFPYEQSNEQEISVLRSANNGFTWDKHPRTVSFRQDHRDGMPVAVQNGEDIFVVIEDNTSLQFKPYIINNKIDNAWEKPVLNNSSQRYSALKTPLADSVYAGAPYLIKTENNIYLISYQTTENRTSEWEHSTMEVVISDKPSDFRNPTQPFNVPLTKEAKWNSLANLGNNKIAALASTNFNSDKIGVWMIIGKIEK